MPAQAAADRETSIRRGVEVLLALGSESAVGRGGLSVTEAAALLEREKSQVSRALKTLAEYGLVDRDPETRAYRIGSRLFALSQLTEARRLVDAAGPLLREVVATVSERSHLSVLQGVEALTLLSDGPAHAVQTVGWVGRVVPVFCTSAGRALLFDLERGELELLLRDVQFRRLARSTVRDVGELWARIVQAREQGYAIVDEEFEPGLVGVAAPVRDSRGRVIAALNVSGPTFRFRRHTEAGAELVRTSARLSLILAGSSAR